jgi:hypothetical protein
MDVVTVETTQAAVVVDALGEVGIARAEAEVMATLVIERRAADVAAGLPFCRTCGCTQNAACIGGCSWATPDLCSRCAR